MIRGGSDKGVAIRGVVIRWGVVIRGGSDQGGLGVVIRGGRDVRAGGRDANIMDIGLGC